MKRYTSSVATWITVVCMVAVLVVGVWWQQPLFTSVALGVLFINALLTILLHMRLTGKNVGWFLLYAGGLGVVANIFNEMHRVPGGQVILDVDQAIEEVDGLRLPFSIKLAGAEYNSYPGTDTLKDLQVVLVAGTGTNLLNEIGLSLHQPFRHEGFLFTLDPETASEDRVLLQVHHNPLRRMLPVCGSIMMLGAFLQISLGTRKS